MGLAPQSLIKDAPRRIHIQLKPYRVFQRSINAVSSKIVVKQGIPIDGTVRAVAIRKAAYGMGEAEPVSSRRHQSGNCVSTVRSTCVVTVPNH